MKAEQLFVVRARRLSVVKDTKAVHGTVEHGIYMPFSSVGKKTHKNKTYEIYTMSIWYKNGNNYIYAWWRQFISQC